MGKRIALRAIGLVAALAIIGAGIAALAQLVSGPSQRDLGPGIVVHQSEVPSEDAGFAERTGEPADPSATPSPSKDPKEPASPLASASPSASSKPRPSKTSSPKPTQGPVKPLPPKAPVDDDDAWDDDAYDDDDDDDG